MGFIFFLLRDLLFLNGVQGTRFKEKHTIHYQLNIIVHTSCYCVLDLLCVTGVFVNELLHCKYSTTGQHTRGIKGENKNLIFPFSERFTTLGLMSYSNVTHKGIQSDYMILLLVND